MECISPPELDDQTLLAFIDGQAPAAVTEHVRQCAHCRERARRLARLLGRLTTLFYRFECPTPAELGEYHLELLPAAQTAAIERHLADCLHCRREVAQLEGYLTHLEPAAQPEPGRLQETVEHARVWLARLVGGGAASGPVGPFALSPAFAGLRGKDAEAPLVYQAQDAQVIIEVKEDAESLNHYALLGLIIGMDEPAGLDARLLHGGQQAAATEVDELGNFVLTSLVAGEYDLILAGSDLEIHVQQVQVGGMERTQQDDQAP